jgi:hypothetical protein
VAQSPDASLGPHTYSFGRPMGGINPSHREARRESPSGVDAEIQEDG